MPSSKQSRLLDSIVFITEYCCYCEHTPASIKTLAEMFACQLILENEKEAAKQIFKLISDDKSSYLHLSECVTSLITELESNNN
jgi:DeoR/GlpR family transcriptional regulator of sugar metabolism